MVKLCKKGVKLGFRKCRLVAKMSCNVTVSGVTDTHTEHTLLFYFILFYF